MSETITQNTCVIIFMSSKVYAKIHMFTFLVLGCVKSRKLDLVKMFLLYGIFGDGHNLTELRWGRVWEQWPMEATITSVKLFLFNILYVRLDKKSALWSESLLSIILSSSLKCNTSILHIQDMYTNKYLKITTRHMLIYPFHKTVCHCCWI